MPKGQHPWQTKQDLLLRLPELQAGCALELPLLKAELASLGFAAGGTQRDSAAGTVSISFGLFGSFGSKAGRL